MKNNKILKVILILITTFILLFIIAEVYYSKVPELQIRKDEMEIEVARGSYNWRSILSGKCVDTIGPEELLQDIQPTKVESDDTILLEFTSKPKEVRVEIVGKDEILNFDIDSNILTVPQEKGIYIIHVISRWKRGSISHVFKVKVE